MTIDLLVQGYSVQEVPCDLTHRATGNDFAGYTHRLHQFLYVLLAATMRFIRHVRAPRQLRLSASDAQVSGAVYQLKTTG